MITCPSCQEQITKEALKDGKACPFCHEVLPQELLAQLQGPQEEPRAAPAASAAGAQVPSAQPAGARGAVATGVEPAIAEDELQVPAGKKRTWLVVLLLVLVAGAGAGAYFVLGRGKKAAGRKVVQVTVAGEKYTLEGFDDTDYQRLLEWRRKLRDKVVAFLADRCDVYRRHRFQVVSKLVEREVFVTPTKKIKQLQIDLQFGGGQPYPVEGFNWLKCPALIAYLHKEHAIELQMKFEEKEQVLGPTLRIAEVTIKGGRFVQDKGTYRSPWDQRRTVISFPRFKKLAKEHPSVLLLSGKNMQRKDRKHMLFGGIPFERVERLPGKSYVVGVWRARVTSDRFLKLFRDWTSGCRGFERDIRDLNAEYRDEDFKLPALKAQAEELARRVCKGLRTIATGLEPWNEAKVREGQEILAQALEFATKNIDEPLLQLAEKIGSTDKPAPWCGDPKQPSPCR